MRFLIIIIMITVLPAAAALSASITGTSKTIGGGTSSVAHCQVLQYDVAANNTITSVNAQVKCNLTDSYLATATVTSGVNSGSGQASVSLSANVAQVVAITISPSVAIGSSTYNVDLLVKK